MPGNAEQEQQLGGGGGGEVRLRGHRGKRAKMRLCVCVQCAQFATMWKSSSQIYIYGNVCSQIGENILIILY